MQFFSKNKKNKGFTLAEVLITIGIIGVVASLTIPNLVSKYQKQETVTKYKKFYSVISQAFIASTAENGMPSTWDWGTAPDNVTTERIIKTYLIPYIAISKDCGFNTTGSCERKSKHFLNGIKSLSIESRYQIVLKDGAMIHLYLSNNVVDGPPTALFMWLDINGNNPPNLAGRDLFNIKFSIADNKPTPHGAGTSRDALLNSPNYGCSKVPEFAPGHFCGALIQYDGWQIKDDYPWD